MSKKISLWYFPISISLWSAMLSSTCTRAHEVEGKALSNHYAIELKANFTWSDCAFLPVSHLTDFPHLFHLLFPICFRNNRKKICGKRNVRSCWATFWMLQSESLASKRERRMSEQERRKKISQANEITFTTFTSYFPISIFPLLSDCNSTIFHEIKLIFHWRWKDWSRRERTFIVA